MSESSKETPEPVGTALSIPQRFDNLEKKLDDIYQVLQSINNEMVKLSLDKEPAVAEKIGPAVDVPTAKKEATEPFTTPVSGWNQTEVDAATWKDWTSEKGAGKGRSTYAENMPMNTAFLKEHGHTTWKLAYKAPDSNRYSLTDFNGKEYIQCVYGVKK